ncbi:Gfo/Idh/MocA family oxidoreductase [Paenibacillus sp. WQ 127069]|uniref:Gfo/Idh/MocA family oxidoreductase n=1 Tax=Paenibacillus baimaensis TaxID=2982185 RepID=A0ABT2UHA3_9BACL|nr:Gfo/Idh/MocA family oxidoreductase [Paenibacillus sp. WQ 127069]MCU6793029.1 Gfo/Idh/MocA family oxidoreductase [Paenibacillus sp. WQ 127069]
MNKVRVAIIGQGRSGRDIHAYSLSQIKEQYEIVAVADLLEERLERAKQELNCDVYADYHDLFKRSDLDLIINASTSNFHYSITKEILEHGFNVLCEKPLARTAAEVDILIDTAKRTGKLLAVYQQSRYAPAYRKVQEIIQSGVIGRVVQVSIAYNNFARRWDWQTLRANNGGNLLNTGPHPVDQALQFFGSEAMPDVTSIMDRANTAGDAEDYVKVILHGQGRPVIDVEISSCCAYPSFTYNVQGTKGGIKGSTTQLNWKYFKPEEAGELKLVTTPLVNEKNEPAYCREQLKWYEESWDIPADQGKDLFHTMAQSFYGMLYETIVHGKALEVTPQQVRQQIAVMEECHRQNL